MENVILITLEDILHYTSVSGSIDEYKVNPHIYNSQILYLEPILGSSLYERIITLVETDSISGETNYKTLLDSYITPSLVFHTMELFVPMNSFLISEGGTFQFQPTNANPTSQSEIDRLSNKYRTIADKYDSKLVAYLCKNSSLFPEYTTNTGLVDKAETTNRSSGWYLGLNNIKSNIRI
jgi:hypothetical protein